MFHGKYGLSPAAISGKKISYYLRCSADPLQAGSREATPSVQSNAEERHLRLHVSLLFLQYHNVTDTI